MLTIAGSIMPPAIIGNDEQKTGTIAKVARQEISIDGFIANGRAHLPFSIHRIKDSAVVLSAITAGGSAQINSKLSKKPKDFWIRHLLYARHKFRLMIYLNPA